MTDAHERTVTGATLVDTTLPDSPSASTFKNGGGSTLSGSTATPEERIIPPTHPNRTLVLCFDGTGDQFDSDNSNIVEFFTMLKKDDRDKQMVYYQAGIGTYTNPQIATPLGAKISKALDEAIAWNLDAHVMGGYEFLMQNYTAGDRICIFGFSRGAYTARSLAGMIHKVGILPACNHQQVPFAYKMFTRTDEVGWQQSTAFKKAFSIDADIEFIGVWDTVNSVGLIPKRLPFTTSNTIVRTFRHAVSLDERRAKFKANLWNHPTEGEAQLGTGPKADPAAVAAAATATGANPTKAPSNNKTHPGKGHSLEKKYSKDRNLPTDIEEVWFAGCHCDVGGGSVGNDIKPNLARIPLRWMIRECFKTKTGIMFHADMLEQVMGMDPAALHPTVLPRPPALKVNPDDQSHCLRTMADDASIAKTNKAAAAAASADENSEEGTLLTTAAVTKRPTEEELELLDALSPVYDQLSLAWFWWILEFFPIRIRYQAPDHSWISYLGWNLGRGRTIPRQQKEGVKVHRSVKMRMEARFANGQKYVPKAGFDERYTTWVD